MSTNRPVAQYLLTVALIAAFAFFSAGVSIGTNRITEETLRVSIKDSLSGKDSSAVKVKRIRPRGGSSLSFSHVFTAAFPDGSVATVFVVSITGHSGPFPAIYIRRAGSSASFAGLLGVKYPMDAWRYGLTDRTLQSWADRVTSVAQRYGDVK
jgi:hypothetical protein